MTSAMDTSKAVAEWLNSMKHSSKIQYSSRWQVWIQYCRVKGLPNSGDAQLEDMKRRRMSSDNTVKYFYDNEVPKFFVWLTTEYKGERTQERLSENAAAGMVTAVRSFFAFHRYALEIRKEAIPSVDKITQKFEDHAFDIYQLRAMFNQGDLMERAVLAVGKDLALRVGDIAKLDRDMMSLHIRREEELAENEKRNPDIVGFELITEKEKEPASCHLSRETVELLKEYLRTYPKKNGYLFPLTEDAFNDLLRRLADRAKITVNGRLRWHCLRKFFITMAHGKVTEPVMKYMVGKHIEKSLRTYIQDNRETFKAFKMLEPLISLTKSNGSGSSQLAKELEELKKATFKQMVLLKLIEKLTPKEEMRKAISELAKELGIPEVFPIKVGDETEEPLNLGRIVEALAGAYEKKDLERILRENGNSH